MWNPAQTAVIVNPAAAGGEVGRRWATLEPQLSAVLGPVRYYPTHAVGHGTQLAQEALQAGATTLLSLGGDGTHSEVVAGIVRSGAAAGAVTLGLLPQGTGGDFKRLLADGPLGLIARAARLPGAQRARIDLGRVTFQRHDGTAGERVFLNMASVGMGGLVCELVNASNKRFGGQATFLSATLRALLRYDPPSLALSVDGEPQGTFSVHTLAVANGRYAGGGMNFAPSASLDDGRFDITLVQSAAPLRSLSLLPKLYNGHLAEHALVRTWRGSSVSITPTDAKAAWLEVDGEPLGVAPVHATCLPGLIDLLDLDPSVSGARP